MCPMTFPHLKESLPSSLIGPFLVSWALHTFFLTRVHLYKNQKLGSACGRGCSAFVFPDLGFRARSPVSSAIRFPARFVISFYGWIKFHVYMCHIFIICSSADGRLGWIHFLEVVNRAAVNVGEQVSLWWDGESPGYAPRSAVAGSWRSSNFSF